MKIKKRIRLFFLLLSGIGLFVQSGLPGSTAVADDLIIISNKNVLQDTLSRQNIKDIFLGKKTTWDDNTKIIFVILKNGDLHKRFLKEYTAKTPTQYNRYWKKLVFSGKGKRPKHFDTEANLLQYVKTVGGAIGYVSSETQTDEIKKISIK